MVQMIRNASRELQRKTPEELHRARRNLQVWGSLLVKIARRVGISFKNATIEESVRAADEGSTHAVFIIRSSYVVKIFNEGYSGGGCFAVENAAYDLVEDVCGLTPRRVATGTARSGGRKWPYIVSTYVPGVPLSKVANHLTAEQWHAVGSGIGDWLACVSKRPLPQTGPLRASWTPYSLFLARQLRTCMNLHERIGFLPGRLTDQIPQLLQSCRELIPNHEPRLVHGDLHDGHVLIEDLETAGPLAFIDFNDMLVGDPMYALVVLHTRLTHCRKDRLRPILEALHIDPTSRTWQEKMMILTLAHDWDEITPIVRAYPSLSGVRSLAELTSLLWDPDSPGLESLSNDSDFGP